MPLLTGPRQLSQEYFDPCFLNISEMVLHMIIKQLQKHIVSRVGIFPRNYVGIKYMYFQHGQIQGTAVYNS